MKTSSTLFFLLFLSVQGFAQSIFLVDNLYFKFEEHDMTTGQITDHRDLTGGLPFHTYDCITWHPEEKVFYVGYKKYLATDRIVRYDAKTKLLTPLITSGLSRVVDLDFDLGAGKMYFLDKDANLIQRANLDGSNIEQVGPGQSFLTGWTPVLAVDEAHGLLFFTIGGGNIQYTDLNTWSPSVMPSPVYVAGGRVGDIAIDETNTWIYWTYNLTQEPSSINRTNLETFETQTLHSDMEPHNYLSLYNGRVYWSTTGTIIHSVTLTGDDLKMEYDVPSGTFAADFVIGDGSSTGISLPDAPTVLAVYPNPAGDWTQIDLGDHQVTRLVLMQVNGQIINEWNGQFTGGHRIDTATLPSGSYLLQAFDGEQRTYLGRFSK